LNTLLNVVLEMSDSNSDSDSDAPLTAAELLRRAAGNAKASPETQKPPAAQADDIDDEIRRLEAELEGSSSSSSSDDDDDSDGEYDESSGKKGSSSAVLSLSTMKDDRIEALPASHLPSNKKRMMKIDRGSDEQKQPPSKKLKVSSGLEVAVREVLAGYVARSSEKIPFYCRHCAKQYANEPEFKDHKNTEFHKKAVEIERKATYCKLCRKQLTSPAQMKEHLTSRPHKQHLDKVRAKQGQAQGRGGNMQGRGGNMQGRGGNMQGRGGNMQGRGGNMQGRGGNMQGRGGNMERRQWS
jgi:hypothetical protein